MSSPPLSRKEREKLARQQEILAAARSLFLSKGYHETTLEEIARHAEFGKGTIYNYFNSKEDLFRAINHQLFDRLLQVTQSAMSAPDSNCRQKLFHYAHGVIIHARKNSEWILLAMQRGHSLKPGEGKQSIKNFADVMQKIWNMISKVFQVEIENQRIRALDPMALAMLFDGMVRTYCFNHVKFSHIIKETEIEQTAELIVSIFLDGIALDKISLHP